MFFFSKSVIYAILAGLYVAQVMAIKIAKKLGNKLQKKINIILCGFIVLAYSYITVLHSERSQLLNGTYYQTHGYMVIFGRYAEICGIFPRCLLGLKRFFSPGSLCV